MEPLNSELTERIKPVKLVLFDVDGTLTDGRLYYDAHWVESKAFDVRDGFGIYLLHQNGLKTGIVTGRESAIVAERARELGIEIVYQSRPIKDEVLAKIKQRTGLTEAQMGYVADDLFDLPLLLKVGFSAAPADAHAEVRQRVHYVAQRDGGRGAVREVCDLILRVQGCWEGIINQFTR